MLQVLLVHIHLAVVHELKDVGQVLGLDPLKTKLQNPLIYLRGIKSKDLTNILEFMYHGQVNVYEEDLQHFLALAQELQLKGLGGMEKQGDKVHEVMKKVNPCRTTMTEECGDKREDQSLQIVNDLGMEENSLRSPSVKIEGIETENQSWEEDALDLTDFPVDPSFKVQLGDGGLEELDQQIASMMMKGDDNIWTCTVCGKKATKGRKPGMKNHIEAMHIESMPHPCDICGQTYKLVSVFDASYLTHNNCRTRNTLRKHKSISHRGMQSGLIPLSLGRERDDMGDMGEGEEPAAAREDTDPVNT